MGNSLFHMNVYKFNSSLAVSFLFRIFFSEKTFKSPLIEKGDLYP